MRTQNFSNHRRWSPTWHFVYVPLLLVLFIGSLVNLEESWKVEDRWYSASLIVMLVVMLGFLGLFARMFALRAQDRAIRAEETLRLFMLGGSKPDHRLRIGQLIALRFASDEEVVMLAQRAVSENMSSLQIKKAIKNWRPDWHRV